MRGVRFVNLSDIERIAIESAVVDSCGTELPGPHKHVVLACCRSMPDGADPLSVAFEEFPGAPVVALVITLDLHAYAEALARGVAGVVQLDSPPEVIASVVAAALRGELVLPTFVGQGLAAEAVGAAPPKELTDIEQATLRGLVNGESVEDVADRLGLSSRTVRRYRQSAFIKIGATDRGEGLRIARKLQL